MLLNQLDQVVPDSLISLLCNPLELLCILTRVLQEVALASTGELRQLLQHSPSQLALHIYLIFQQRSYRPGDKIKLQLLFLVHPRQSNRPFQGLRAQLKVRCDLLDDQRVIFGVESDIACSLVLRQTWQINQQLQCRPV